MVTYIYIYIQKSIGMLSLPVTVENAGWVLQVLLPNILSLSFLIGCFLHAELIYLRLEAIK